MTTYSDVKSTHQTLTGTTADLVQLLQYWDGVEVSNRSGTGALSVVFNTTTAPTALVAGSEVVEPGVTKLFSPAPQRGSGVPGDTNFPCMLVGIVGSSNAYSVAGVAGQEG